MTRLRAALRPTNAEPPAPDLYGVLEFDGIRSGELEHGIAAIVETYGAPPGVS